MKLLHCLLVLFVALQGCSKSFTITASRIDSDWFGMGQGIISDHENSATCSVKRFGLWAKTDIPYDSKSSSKPTGCKGDCMPTELINFYNLPLAKGRYELALPDTCLGSNVGKVHLFRFTDDPNVPNTIESLPGIIDGFDYEGTNNSWVSITGYNAKSGIVKGKFDVTLVSKKGEIVRFEKGKFKTKLL